MENQERHTELFDKFVLGTLTKAEEKELNELIEKDSKLKLEFESHKLLVDGIKLARKEELKEYLKEHGKVEYFENIWGPTWRKASIAIVAIFVGAFLVVEFLIKNPGTTNPVATKEKSEKVNNASEEEPLSDPSGMKEDEYVKHELNEEKIVMDSPLDKDQEALFKDKGDSTLAQMEESEDTEIAKYKPAGQMDDFDMEQNIAEEKKLLDTTFIAVVVPTINLSESSIQQTKESALRTRQTTESDKAKTLKKSAGDAVDTLSKELKNEVKQTTISVSLWQSPIHFKGYRYQENLRIYGVAMNDLRLISYNKTLYIKIGEQYAPLIKSPEYLPFKFITDKTLIEHLNAY